MPAMDHLDLPEPIVHPTAFVAHGTHLYGHVDIGPHAVVMFGTVMRGELDRIVVGARSNVQDNSIFHADRDMPVIIGDDVTIGHAAIVHGAKVGNHCLVGIGSRALNGSEMGEGSWLAAGSLLAPGKVIPPWTLAVGTPAKPIRSLTEEELESQRSGVADYQMFAATYQAMILD